MLRDQDASIDTDSADSRYVNMKALPDRHVTCKYREKDVSLSMKIKDFAAYVKAHEDATRDQANGTYVKQEFRFTDHLGKEQVIEDVRQSVLYMIDLDVIKLLPKLYEAILCDFKLPGILPGGVHCMMNAVSDCLLCTLYCSCVCNAMC